MILTLPTRAGKFKCMHGTHSQLYRGLVHLMRTCSDIYRVHDTDTQMANGTLARIMWIVFHPTKEFSRLSRLKTPVTFQNTGDPPDKGSGGVYNDLNYDIRGPGGQRRALLSSEVPDLIQYEAIHGFAVYPFLHEPPAAS